MKIAIQCDFDGTITEDDVGYILLDTFADGNWRQILADYLAGRIPVGTFNRKSFALVKADQQTLTNFVLTSDMVRVRPGFKELLDYCSRKGYEFVIVSNGLTFYIEAILENEGVKGIEVFASQNQFSTEGLKVKYIGPDGSQMEAGFKEAYTEMLKGRGYSVVYIGNGPSDIHPAKRAIHVFATGDLLRRCQEEQLEYTPFDDLNDVVRSLETLSLG